MGWSPSTVSTVVANGTFVPAGATHLLAYSVIGVSNGTITQPPAFFANSSQRSQSTTATILTTLVPPPAFFTTTTSSQPSQFTTASILTTSVPATPRGTLSSFGVSVALVDFAPPASVPMRVDFVDTDLRLRHVGGIISIERAVNETSVNFYVVYWGRSATGKLGESYSPGLVAQFFNYPAGNVIPSFESLTPIVTRVDRTVDYEPTLAPWPGLDFNDEFAALWTGFVWITQPGQYGFRISSDDGSRLIVDDDEVAAIMAVCQVSGFCLTTDAEGWWYLEAGYHSLRLEYFENQSYAGMVLSYAGPDTLYTWVTAPPDVLFHEAGAWNSVVGNLSVRTAGSFLAINLANTAIPSGATHFLAYTAGSMGESSMPAWVPIV